MPEQISRRADRAPRRVERFVISRRPNEVPTALIACVGFTEREERHAIAMASERPFTEWDQIFTDKRLCQATVDRLTFGAHTIETSTQPFRLGGTTAKRKAAAA
ncbi:ATP-binding protein [Streptomyces sp. NPDC059534]|uniref:ATP-binding protein n=1 Tax=Streptomyces sp. NPDC059534 TaxID=3346859 RepID=UPI003698B4FC